MKTIVIGFDNPKGLGTGRIIKGLETSQPDQIKFVHDAKTLNTFPEGIKYLSFCVIEERVTAIETTKPKIKPNPKENKTMKKFLTLIGAAVLFVAATSQAQSPVYSAQSLNSTATLAASAATNVAVVIDCRKQAYVTVGLKVQADAANSGNIIANYSYSLDGSTYGTQQFNFGFAANGTTAAQNFTNLNTLGCGYIKINYLTNAAASGALTNIVLNYGIKVQAN